MKTNSQKKTVQILVAGWHSRLDALVSELEAQKSAGKTIEVVILDTIEPDTVQNAEAQCLILYTGALPDGTSLQDTLAHLRQACPRTAHSIIITDTDTEAEIARTLYHDTAVVISQESLYIRIAAQTARQTGLAEVYEELISFAGNDVYTVPAGRLAGLPYSRTLRFYENACIAGIISRGIVRLNPPMNTLIQKDDLLILIAQNLETITESPAILPAPDITVISKTAVTTKRAESFLVFGWNRFCNRLLQELSHYTGDGSSVRVIVNKSVSIPAIQRLQTTVEQLDINSRNVLESIVYEYYENIIVVDNETLHEQVQSVLNERGLANNVVFFKNPLVQDAQTKRIFKLAAQAALHPTTAAVFSDLTNPEGAEIYLKPAGNYIEIDTDTDFYTIIESARRLNETAIGYILHETGDIVINPAKDKKNRFYHFDKIIVLADEH